MSTYTKTKLQALQDNKTDALNIYLDMADHYRKGKLVVADEVKATMKKWRFDLSEGTVVNNVGAVLAIIEAKGSKAKADAAIDEFNKKRLENNEAAIFGPMRLKKELVGNTQKRTSKRTWKDDKRLAAGVEQGIITSVQAEQLFAIKVS